MKYGAPLLQTPCILQLKLKYILKLDLHQLQETFLPISNKADECLVSIPCIFYHRNGF